MREIGSEFWDVPVSDRPGSLFPEDTQWFLSGRSALRSIIAELVDRCRTVAMPSWCCDSMLQPFAEAGMEIRFYPVYPDDGGLVTELRKDCDVLFLMDYFGYTAPPPDLSGYRGIVIRDVTHSLLSGTYEDADYSFGSLRKWCGVLTGGFARAKDGHPLPAGGPADETYVSLRKEAMRRKAAYIAAADAEPDGTEEAGEKTGDKTYLRIFAEAEERLDAPGIFRAAGSDTDLAYRLDAEGMKARRRENAKILREAFPEMLLIPEMRSGDCPLFVPVLVPDGRRDALRRFLIREQIYCPVHWPVSGYHRLGARERVLYEKELSLVCDQRYTKEDMVRMTDAIHRFREEG